MEWKNKMVAILGAGPVGLTMARLLQRQGIAVTVYERDRDAQARIWGGTLDLHTATGQPALQRAGLLQQYYDLAKPMGRTVVDEHGQVLFAVPPAYDTPEINRNALRKLLLGSLEDNTVVWDRKCIHVKAQNGKWNLHFENKPEATADFVIVADGGLSRSRTMVTDAVIEYTGTFIIQGEVHQPEINCAEFYNLCGGTILMTAGAGLTFAANPDNNGALTYGVTFRKPGAWVQQNGLDFQDRDSISMFLSRLFEHAHPRFRQLFHATSFFAGLPARRLPLEIPWKHDRPLPITLIGDAAHIMPPFAGQGVNTGMMDALILSDNLANGKFETIEMAIHDYEQKMFAYASEAQRQTSQNEIAMHREDYSFKKRFTQ
jgi:tetracycline resistance monooxygenase